MKLPGITQHTSPIAKKWSIFGFILLAAISNAMALTIVETMDAYRDNTISDIVVPGHLSSWFNDGKPAGGGAGMSIFTSQDGLKIVNYVGDYSGTMGVGRMMAALKFIMPQTSATLASASLYLKVYDQSGSPFAKISLASDNNWAEAADGYSTFPDTTTLTTLISSQSVTASGWNTFSLPISNVQTRVSSLSADTMSLVLTGSTASDNFFNFYSDDDANNNSGSTSNNAYLVLVFKPQVQSVSVPTNGTYKVGDALNFTVAFDSAVTVTGSPTLSLTLNTGGTVSASYVSGSGTNNLVFRYTVASGIADADGITVGSLSLNGGTIKSAGGNDASLTLNSIASTTSVLVDGIAPSISTVSPPSSGTYTVGQNLDYIVNFDDAVNVVISSGTPYLTLTIGSSTVHAAYVSGTTTSALKFRYTVVSGDLDADGVAVASNITLNSGTIKDAAGNDATLTFTGSTAASVLVDAVAPTISGVTGPSAGTYGIGDDLDFTVATGEDVTVTGSPYIAVTVGGVTRSAAYVSGSGTSSLIFRYTLASGDEGALASGSSITLDGGSIKDAAGNALASTSFTAPTISGVTIDAVAPAISGVTGPSAGTYALGDTLWFTATFSEAVAVTGSPSITVTVGGSSKQAVYASGSGTTTLKFRYVLVSGDYDSDGIATGTSITLNGGAIQDAAGNDATLTFTAPTTAVLVDAVAPTISGVTGPSAGTYGIGDDLDFTVATGEDVTVTGSPYIAVTVGGVTRSAAYVSGSGTSSLVFRYTLASGDEGSLASGSSIALDGGSIKDAAGNALASTSFTAPTISGVTIDAVAPAISGVTGPSAGTYASGDTLWFTATFSEDVTVTGSPYIPLTVGSSTKQGVYASGSGTTALKFRYVLSSGDSDADGIATGTSITLNGGAIQDAAGNEAVLTFTAPTTTAVLVDAVAPTISGVTGPSAGTYGIGDDLDFTVATGEDVTVTGSPYIAVTVGGVTRSAAYVSGSGTSSLVFRYTLASGDEGSLASGSSIALDGGTIKDAAGNALASTSFTAPAVSGVTIDAVAPTISGVTGPSAGTYASGDTLWLTATLSENVTVTGSPYIPLTVGSSTKQALYASGSGTTALKFRYVLVSGDYDSDGIATGTGVTLNGGAVQDAAGNEAVLTFTAPTTTAVLVDAVAPTISGVTGPSAGTYGIGDHLDFTVNTSEDVTVIGSPYIGITVGGVTKTAAYVSGSGTSSLVFRYTLASGDEGSLASGSSIALDGGTIKDAAGNALASTSFTAPAVSGVNVDAVAPTISGVTGPSAGTYASGDTLWFTATFSEDVTVTGSPYIPLTVGSSTKQAVYASGSGTTLLKFRYVLSSGDSDANGIAMGGSIVLSTASIQDAAGNDATLTFTAPTTTAVLVDAITPTVFSVNPPDAGTYGIGDHLDFTVNTSEDVTVTGTPYIAITIGEETAKAVYVSGSGTSALTFRYTLVVGDAGTVSTGSSITLNGGAVQDAAGNEAVLTFTAPTTTTVLVDAVAPAISGVTGPSAGTYASGDTLWFTATFDEDVAVSGTPSIGLTIGSDARQALYVSGSGTTTLKFGYEVASGDADADGIGVDASISLNDGSIADDAGNAPPLDLGTFDTEDVFVNNQPTITVQKNFDPAGYSLRSVSSSGLFHVELPAGAHHAEIILLDAAGRRLTAKTLDVSSSNMDVYLPSSARWNLAVLRVDGHVKATARGGVPLR